MLVCPSFWGITEFGIFDYFSDNEMCVFWKNYPLCFNFARHLVIVYAEVCIKVTHI